MRQQVLKGFASRGKRLSGIGVFRALSKLVVEEDTGLRLNRDHVRAGLNGIVDGIYQDTALWHARNAEASDHCAKLMTDKGMYALLGSADMVKRAALLGLVASLNSYRGQIDQVFRERGYDLQDTLYKLSQCWDRHGFPPQVMETSGEDALLVPLI